jgi:hypothetical protein
MDGFRCVDVCLYGQVRFEVFYCHHCLRDLRLTLVTIVTQDVGPETVEDTVLHHVAFRPGHIHSLDVHYEGHAVPTKFREGSAPLRYLGRFVRPTTFSQCLCKMSACLYAQQSRHLHIRGRGRHLFFVLPSHHMACRCRRRVT